MLMRRTHSTQLAVVVVASAALALAACSSSSSTTGTTSAKTFGVNATGVVHFWTRQATDGPAKALVAKFNATQKNLKIVIHLTPPNDDTSQLATSIRAGDEPDVVGLNDIDVPSFARQGALLNITKYVDALPYKSALSPGHLQLATANGEYFGVPTLLTCQSFVQQNAVQQGWPEPERPAIDLRPDRDRF